MVRFIISNKEQLKKQEKDLHSNMVRFIIDCQLYFKRLRKAFTFQYG